MIFDFGGGKLEVTCLEINEEGDVKILSFAGDNKLGG